MKTGMERCNLALAGAFGFYGFYYPSTSACASGPAARD
jgi:hypothetical protein